MTDQRRDNPHILIVDDDVRIRQMVARYLEEAGFYVSDARDGAGLRETLSREPIDLVLLDLVLPGDEDGLTLARDIRSQSNVPIIMLSGRDDVVDRVVGLEIGADDYIAKPFHLRELLARIRTELRRQQPTGPPQQPGDGRIRFDGWILDPQRRSLSNPRKTQVDLTTGEFDLLMALAQHPGRVFSRDSLMMITRSRNHDVYDRSIDTQIARLRKKLQMAGDKANTLIKSVRGVGYVFTGQPGGQG